MEFPKALRVRTRREYLRFFNQSEVKRLESCILFRIPNALSRPRIGMTVKARVNSVYRNKLKRQIREAFRLNQKKLQSFDYNVVIPGHVKVNYLTPKKVRRNLESLWSQSSNHEMVF